MNPPAHNLEFGALRLVYKLALVVWFIIIAFWLGPHVILFHRLSGLSVADFTSVAEEHIPVVQAIKRYQADNGHLPEKVEDLEGDYLPHLDINSREADPFHRGFILQSDYHVLVFKFGFFHELVYKMDGDDEHWQVSGTVVKGRIPLPAITVPKEYPMSVLQ